MLSKPAEASVDRFLEEQLFEEDVRAVVQLLRPHRNERLEGWHEYRTGGADFRATISWRANFAGRNDCNEGEELLVPKMAEVLEAILIGSTRNPDELSAEEEFGIYRRVVRELYRRLNELQSRYH